MITYVHKETDLYKNIRRSFIHNSPKLKITQEPLRRKMDTHNLAYAYNRTGFRNKKDRATNMHNDWGEPQKCRTEWEKPGTNGTYGMTPCVRSLNSDQTNRWSEKSKSGWEENLTGIELGSLEMEMFHIWCQIQKTGVRTNVNDWKGAISGNSQVSPSRTFYP